MSRTSVGFWRAPYGRGVLHMAAASGTVEECRSFLLSPLNCGVDGADDRGETPLFSALYAKNWETVHFLIESGADVTWRSKSGETPLHVAANTGTKEIVELLVSKGADVHAKSDLKTSLDIAAATGNLNTLEYLLELKANGLNDKQVYVGPFLRKQERDMAVDKTRFTNVFVKNLSEGTTEEDLQKVFSEHGTVTSVAVMRDEEGKSKCFGFINFENSEDAAKAVDALNGYKFDSKDWFVGKAQKKSEREQELKNRFEQTVKEAADKSQGLNLYVKNLDDTISDEKLRELFTSFGNVTSCKVMRDPHLHELYEQCMERKEEFEIVAAVSSNQDTSLLRKAIGYLAKSIRDLDNERARSEFRAFLFYPVTRLYVCCRANRALEVLNFTPLNGKPIRVTYSHRDPSIRKSGEGNIFIKNLDKAIDHKALHETFSTFGTILSCKVATDISGQSKGYGFVQYDTDEAAQKAIEKLNGMLLNDKQVYVGSFLRKQERDMAVDKTRFTNVFVKNLSEGTTEEDLQKVFSEHGTVTSVAVMRDEEGKSKCFGFINFENSEDAAKAVDALNGYKFDSKDWFVGKAQKKSEREQELKNRFEQTVKEAADKSQGLNLYVKNLDDTISDEKLRELFTSFGNVTSCKVMRDPHLHELYEQCMERKEEFEIVAAVSSNQDTSLLRKAIGYLAKSIRDSDNERARSEFRAFLFYPVTRLYVYCRANRALEVLNFTPLNGKPIRVTYSHRDPIRKSGEGNIFIKNLDKAIDHKALHETFSTFGTILSCKVATDISGQSKGYGFVQYDTDEAAQKAIEKLNGMLLNDKQVYVGSFLRKQERDMAVDKTRFTNVFVKNLSEGTTEEDLQKVISEHGTVTSVAVMRDEEGESKCFGFINFENSEDAAKAVDALNGYKFDSKDWFVGKAQKKSEREQELKNRFEQTVKEAADNSQGLNLYVKNLDDTISDEKLRELFTSFGNVTSCKVMRDPHLHELHEQCKKRKEEFVIVAAVSSNQDISLLRKAICYLAKSIRDSDYERTHYDFRAFLFYLVTSHLSPDFVSREDVIMLNQAAFSSMGLCKHSSSDMMDSKALNVPAAFDLRGMQSLFNLCHEMSSLDGLPLSRAAFVEKRMRELRSGERFLESLLGAQISTEPLDAGGKKRKRIYKPKELPASSRLRASPSDSQPLPSFQIRQRPRYCNISGAPFPLPPEVNTRGYIGSRFLVEFMFVPTLIETGEVGADIILSASARCDVEDMCVILHNIIRVPDGAALPKDDYSVACAEIDQIPGIDLAWPNEWCSYHVDFEQLRPSTWEKHGCTCERKVVPYFSEGSQLFERFDPQFRRAFSILWDQQNENGGTVDYWNLYDALGFHVMLKLDPPNRVSKLRMAFSDKWELLDHAQFDMEHLKVAGVSKSVKRNKNYQRSPFTLQG